MRSYLLFLCLLCSGMVLAQDKVITGTVTSSEDGTALPGVSVVVKGTNIGTNSDIDGAYRIATSGEAITLVFSFVGMNTKEVVVTNQSVINVALANDHTQLSEVVVTGYGSQQRRDVTGSVGTIKGDNFKTIAVPSVDKYLQGQVAGVQASVPSGMLGEPARVRIRGVNSISNSSDPLYVVDGLPYISGDQGVNTSYNPLGDINPNDIESLEVLKDGSATAIYGSRAANGVILITTKKGKLGAPKFTYDAWFASSRSSKKFDLMNADEFIEVTNEKLTNAGLSAAAFQTAIPNESGKNYDTDWQKEILRNGFQHNHSLSFSGATPQTNYYFSLGYANLEGNIDANSQTKYSFRAKLDQKAFNDKLTFGMNTFVTHTTNTGLNTSANGLSGNIAGAIYAFPNVPAMWPDGSYNLSEDLRSLGSGANTRPIYGNYTNQRFVLDNNIYKNSNLNLTGSAFVDLEVIEGLNLRSQIGINYLNGEDYLFYHPGHGDGSGAVNGRIYQYNLPSFRYNWQNTISYNKTIGQHKIGAVAGIEFQKTNARNFFAHGTNLSSVYFGENGNIISGSLTNQFVGGGSTQRAFESYFGRANYSLKDRYLVSATVRYDKISSLPHGNQGATLPGVSVGWRISEEDFFKSAGLDFISELKLRGGYAKVGNVEIGSYPYAGVFAATQYGSWSGIRYDQVGNNNLSFETSKKTNFGLDLSMLSNRISFSAEYFRNNIDNLILLAPTPPSLGIPLNKIAQNVGEMYNRGLEFSLSSTNIQRGSFVWRSNVNLTFVKNEVTKLVNGTPISGAYNRTAEGKQIGSFFGYQSRGVNTANGNPIFEKKDGSLVQQIVNKTTWAVYNPDNKADISEGAEALTQADKRFLGNSNPTWYGGFNNNFNYGNFDLGIFLTFSGGNKVYNVTRQEQLNNQQFANGGKELLDRWTQVGQETDVPRLYFGSDNYQLQNGHLVSRFLENGSFLRVQNLSLGYTLPNGFRNKMKANSFRVYAQVQNAFVFTKYTGLDPELATSSTTSSTNNQSPGIDNRTNPIPRVFTVGLNLGF